MLFIGNAALLKNVHNTKQYGRVFRCPTSADATHGCSRPATTARPLTVSPNGSIHGQMCALLLQC